MAPRSASAQVHYQGILRKLRGRGDRLGLLELQAAADLALALAQGDELEAETLAERLALNLEELPR